MKKNISVLIALVLALSMVFSIAACGESASEVSSNSIVTTEVSSEETSSFDEEAWKNSWITSWRVSSEVQSNKKAAESALIYGAESVVASMPDELPIYKEGSIKLMARDACAIAPKDRKYRYVYYDCPGTADERWTDIIARLRGIGNEHIPGFYASFMNEYHENYDIEREEMFMVSIIKEYNITREEMEVVVDAIVQYYKDFGDDYDYDTSYEPFEIPNLDIIYTLDNDIINEYYRYA